MARRARDRHEPIYRVIVAVDIEAFCHPSRDDPTRVMLRGVLDASLAEALERAGITFERDQLSDLGDGRLLVLDAGVPKLRLLDTFVAGLGASLVRHNRWASPPARVRLRVAVSAGELLKDGTGWTGEALNAAFRLLDAAPVKAALRGADAPLVLVVPDHLYRGVVRHAHGSLDPAAYVPITITEKETSADAWLYLPGQPAWVTLALASVAAGGVPAAPAQAAAATEPGSLLPVPVQVPAVGVDLPRPGYPLGAGAHLPPAGPWAAPASPPPEPAPPCGPIDGPTAITQIVGSARIESIHNVGHVHGDLTVNVRQAASRGGPDG